MTEIHLNLNDHNQKEMDDNVIGSEENQYKNKMVNDINTKLHKMAELYPCLLDPAFSDGNVNKGREKGYNDKIKEKIITFPVYSTCIGFEVDPITANGMDYNNVNRKKRGRI